MEKRRKMLLACVAGGLAVIAAVSCATAGGRGQKVETAAAKRGLVEDRYTEEGIISFGGEYRVIAQASGPVSSLLVEENSRVKKGDVLFTIDSTDYEYEKALAASALAGYEAQLEQSRINQVMTTSPQEYLEAVKQELEAGKARYQSAKSVYEGDQVLYASGAISRVQMETDKAAYEAALSSWQQARGRYEESSRFLESLREEGIDQSTINSRFYNSELNQLTAQIQSRKTAVSQMEEQIARCRVKAERDGIVTSLPVKEMSVIQAGETAAVINSREGMKAEADVLTNIAPYIKEGEPVEVTLQLRGRDETFTGTVEKVYDYADRGTSALGLDEYRVHVRAALDDGEALAGREGYGVNIRFLLYHEQDCLTVPSGAVFQADETYFVYQIEDGRAVRKAVEVEYQTGIRTVITSGLEEGDLVIDQVDSEGIYEGARVRP